MSELFWVVLVGLVITGVTGFPVARQIGNHPRGLHILFFAEMWERFSYYGMRALLIYYLTQHFLFSDGYAQSQYGAYTSLVYLTPLIGGLVADRFLGTRKTVALGALLLVAGHLTMAVEGPEASEALVYDGQSYEIEAEGRADRREVGIVVDGQRYGFGSDGAGGLAIEGLPAGASLPGVLPAGSYDIEKTPVPMVFEWVFYLALSFIVMGVAFLKPNISTIVGQLYPAGDPRRDPGYTLYYYGVNMGAFWSTLLCGYLGVTVGWWAGFGLAGLGMALGWIVFVRGRLLFFTGGASQLPDDVGRPADPVALAKPVFMGLSQEKVIYLLGVLAVPVVWLLFRADGAVRRAVDASIADFQMANGADAALPFLLGFGNFFVVIGVFLLIGSVAVIGYIGTFMARHCNRVEAERMILALILVAASVVFWTLFEQAGSSMSQYAERNSQMTIVGDVSMTAAQTQSFNAGFILIFAPFFAWLWAFLGRKGKDLDTPMKFALALVQVGGGFMLLVWGANFADDSFKVPLIFLAGAYLLHTTGELFLSPVGLSMITKLSVARVVSTMMAVWFLSSAWAQWLGAVIARLTRAETVGGRVLDPAASLSTYVEVFKTIGLFAIVLGVVLAVASPLLKKMAHGADRSGG